MDLGTLFRELSLRGLRRATVISRSPDDRIRVQRLGAGPEYWALLLVCTSILLGILLELPFEALLPGALATALIGWLIGRRLGAGVSRKIVKQYQHWVLRDEILVIVDASGQDLEQVLQVFRLTEESHPGIFFIRSFDLPDAPESEERREPVAGERLKSEASRLASTHRLAPPEPQTKRLLQRLSLHEATIRKVVRDLNESLGLEQSVSPAAEWLLDNAYAIQAHATDFRRNLPRKSTHFLPVLATEETSDQAGGWRRTSRTPGPTRVEQIARELVLWTDSKLNRDNIQAFVQAYQSLIPLTIAELWLLPLMLRFALLEQLHIRSVKVARRQHERELADFWANRLLHAARRDPDELLLVLAELARQTPVLQPHFAVRLIGHLYDEEAAFSAVQNWLEREFDSPLPEVIHQEQMRQAVDKVSVANAITSLRYLGESDWTELFETLSRVDRLLRQDPGETYMWSDFRTRDRCRQAVEEISRLSGRSEVEVAQEALRLAARTPASAGPLAPPKTEQVAYYLIDRGRPELEAALQCPVPVRYRVLRFVYRHSSLGYLGTTALIVGLILGLGVFLSEAFRSPWSVFIFVLLGMFPSLEIAVQLVNYLISSLIPPQILPKLSFEKTGIPERCKTLVIVPMILLTPDSIRTQLNRLEVNYLGNRDPNLLFGLLSDFPDAPTAERPEDRALYEIAAAGIEQLNRKYQTDTFYLFHRARVWSESEQAWVGWERKRGKLEELNCLLNGEPHPWGRQSYGPRPDKLLRIGTPARLRGVRYVITLDADTQMPPGTARRLIETIAHPLNEAEVARDRSRVLAGYAIIQPRVSTILPEAVATRFTRLFTEPGGTDPYTPAVSDAYQDLFAESIYHGKAIYDVRAFHRVLSGRFPPETLLSHDLIEGCYLRVALASDIEILEAFPHFYHAWIHRLHRWIRGDWQIMSWVFPWVPRGTSTGITTERNPLTVISRWKIFDNLRRSLTSPACLALLLGAWFSFLAPSPAITLVVVTLFSSALIRLLNRAIGARPLRQTGWRRESRGLQRGLLEVVFLPLHAWVSLDAVARAVYRRFVSRRRLLEWETAQVSHWMAGHRINHVMVQTGLAGIASCLLFVFLSRDAGQDAWLSSLPFVLAWIVSPVLADLLARGDPDTEAEPDLSLRERAFLRALARRTWRYFDELVGPRTNWLPPDNSQEALQIEVAERTSPTNIGLGLLSVVAAQDFGYLTPDQLLERLRLTLCTIARLERYEGHLLNWYDTATLEPLRPPYVSTVDSGNLLACYIVLQEALAELSTKPLLGNVFNGLQDTLALISPLPFSEDEAADAEYLDLKRLIETPAGGTLETTRVLRELKRHSARLVEWMSGRDGQEPSKKEQLYWISQLASQVAAWNAVVDSYLSGFEQLCRLTEVPDESLWDAAGVSIRNLRKEPVERLFEALAGKESSAEAEAAEQLLRQNMQAAAAFEQQIVELREQIQKEIDRIDMRFLYDPARRLFAIGYNPAMTSKDTSYYDLLASEARLASLIAISRGEVPVRHWFSLSRPFGTSHGHKVLLSWSGTMFEYLMPMLFTRTFRTSLLDHACREAVMRQIEYGREHRVPWGISESAFSALDSRQIYQYRAFGVSGLALKREADAPPVVAPYATVLALMVSPRMAVRNLRRLAELGMLGDRGFLEAIDFTRESQREGRLGVVIQAYMAHHQGMSLLAIDNVLNQAAMQQRFHRYPLIKSVEPLLFESLPSQPPVLLRPVSDRKPVRLMAPMFEPGSIRVNTPDTAVPRVHLQSNGNYHLLVTNSGGGYARWREFDITRWRADTTRDDYGSFCYVRDLGSGAVWSTGFHPLNRPERRYSVTFSSDRIEFRRRDYETETLTQILVSPEEDAEIRLITITNRSLRSRRFQLTSYAELALAPHGADVTHPAFQKIFIETAALPEKQALLAWRRVRAPDEKPIWVGHILAGRIEPRSLEYETDREAFLGRGRTTKEPAALPRSLSGRTGFVLDPIFSLRADVRVDSGQQARVAFITVCAESRDELERLLEKYRDLNLAERALEMAWTRAQLQFRYLGIQADEAQQFMELASHMVYPNDRMRASPERLRQNRLSQNSLWGHGISGDLPVLLVTVSDFNDVPLVREALLAHSYWAVRGLKTDLVILNQESGGYEQPLQEELKRLIHVYSLRTGANQPGGIHLKSADQIPPDDLNLLFAVARVALAAARGSLAQQLTDSLTVAPDLPPPLEIARYYPEEPSPRLPFMELNAFNGFGGFTDRGREYVIYLEPEEHTPAPWTNVIANASFGTLVTEAGLGCTWCENSQNNRLTAWSNDPVTNQPSEAIYLRDEDTGTFWTPTPLPIRELDPYRIRHGQGYSVFEHNSHGIEQELTVFVPMYEEGGEPIRIQRLRLRNSSSRRRRLTVMAYYEITQGTDHEETQMHVVTNWDNASSSLLARNSYQSHFKDRVTFAAINPVAISYSGDRRLFLGRNRSLSSPVALQHKFLSRRSGAGLDPCLALQTAIELRPGEERDVILPLGQANSLEQARSLIQRYRDPLYFEEALASTKAWWDSLLNTIEVTTPEDEINWLLNRWLMYQTLACRIWARSAFYQSGGAFGFRDQLQDMMAAVYVLPGMARDHVLLAASRQFREGDVQHWWHQSSGAGIRTRCSDDLLWLPYVAAHYAEVTGDEAIFDVRIPFLEGPPLGPTEHEAYFTPAVSIEDGTLFEHCIRAIRKASQLGPHGLPLIGSGDWNDGMNRVGIEGRGESVWLGWFFVEVLKKLMPLCERRQENQLLAELQGLTDSIIAGLESQGWDGEWYRRAYFDDGTPIGSKSRTEARIDSLPQSWAAISLGSTERTERAMKAVEKHLVREEDKLVLLFDPPFDKSTPHPGYIMGYPPGVRENGGQYSHGALWVALAYARMGDGTRAAQLLRMMNPIEHTRTPEDALRYKGEPYAVAADVYALEGQKGRAGWTWYTGSSGWMYRIWIEEILGFKLRGNRFCLEPCLPNGWKGFSLRYDHGDSSYTVTVENPDGVSQGVVSIEVNGKKLADKWIPLKDNGRNNRVLIRMGAQEEAPTSAVTEPHT